MTRVAVVVPFRSDGAERDRHWAWLAARWHVAFPDWELRLGEHPASAGAWCKAVAVAWALEDCTAEVLVVADADVWATPSNVARAAELAAGGAPWVMPHRQVRRLSAATTVRVLAGEPLEEAAAPRSALAERPYAAMRGGGLFVIRRSSWLAVGGFDARFCGWGGEDEAFGRAADALLGDAVRLSGVLWHLWHLPQPRLSRTVGSEPQRQLVARYRAARRDRRAMRQLIDERG
ncbi:galactosyltransferase-related protein [Parafrankia sp. FMc2]|uniref:galactosyltransferase-related protein n=1 Tax=Parafrankia sp. FMc2 TaxID=3233196 RepID=UPI0034D4FCD3